MARPEHLPAFAHVDRTLPDGVHLYTSLLPRVHESPAISRIFAAEAQRHRVLSTARVHIREEQGFAWIDEEVPCIILAASYYRSAQPLDLYLDLLHELTHLRQLDEGRDVWDERFEYVDRETEIEGYAVAVEEGRRLGMSDEDVVAHLSNPWMNAEQVNRLLAHIHRLLAR